MANGSDRGRNRMRTDAGSVGANLYLSAAGRGYGAWPGGPQTPLARSPTWSPSTARTRLWPPWRAKRSWMGSSSRTDSSSGTCGPEAAMWSPTGAIQAGRNIRPLCLSGPRSAEGGMTGAPDISGISRGQIPARVGYLDVKRAVMERIREGVWGPGALLPGEVALAEALGCARATVNRALTLGGGGDRPQAPGRQRVRLSPRRQARRDPADSGGDRGERRRLWLFTDPPWSDAPDWLGAASVWRRTPRRSMWFASTTPTTVLFRSRRWIVVATVPAVATVDFIQEGPNDWLVATAVHRPRREPGG